MGLLKTTDEATPATPGSGVSTVYVDATTLPVLRMVDDAGNDKQLSPIYNASTAVQTPAATTRTYIAGSNITVPAIKMKVGAIYSCRFNMTKTAAGTATSTIDVAVGTAGTTADTARLSFTKPAGTAAADEGWCEVHAVVKTIGASGVLVGEFTMGHNGFAAGAGTGHAVIPYVAVNVTSGAFDTTVANLIIGVCLTSGASDAITITAVRAEYCNG